MSSANSSLTPSRCRPSSSAKTRPQHSRRSGKRLSGMQSSGLSLPSSTQRRTAPLSSSRTPRLDAKWTQHQMAARGHIGGMRWYRGGARQGRWKRWIEVSGEPKARNKNLTHACPAVGLEDLRSNMRAEGRYLLCRIAGPPCKPLVSSCLPPALTKCSVRSLHLHRHASHRGGPFWTSVSERNSLHEMLCSYWAQQRACLDLQLADERSASRAGPRRFVPCRDDTRYPGAASCSLRYRHIFPLSAMIWF